MSDITIESLANAIANAVNSGQSVTIPAMSGRELKRLLSALGGK